MAKHPLERMGKPLDPQWKNGVILRNHVLWRPSWFDIFKFMIGGRLLITSVTITEHKPGNAACNIVARPTTFTDPQDKELALMLKIEAEKGSITRLPSKEQFDYAKKVREDWEKVSSMNSPTTLPLKEENSQSH